MYIVYKFGAGRFIRALRLNDNETSGALAGCDGDLKWQTSD